MSRLTLNVLTATTIFICGADFAYCEDVVPNSPDSPQPNTEVAVPVDAATTNALEPSHTDAAVVTATRFAATIDTAPVNVTVVTAEEIKNSQATTLADAIEQLAGIQVNSLFGISGADAKIDFSGFGATGGQNTLILLNGRRVNDVDLSDANLAAIPMRSVERIEIVRGSSAVLYGDNAVGGVINIVTKSGFAGPAASVNARVGSFGTKELGVQARYSGEQDALYVAANHLTSDGYRDYNETVNTSSVVEYTHQNDNGHFGVRLNGSQDEAQLPGALKEARYRSDPTAKGSETDTNERQGGAELFYNSASYAAELSGRSKHQESSSAFGDTKADLKTLSLTPRIRGEMEGHNYVAGVDLYRSTLDASGGFGDASDATRDSYAIYGSDRLAFNQAIALDFSMRAQNVSLDMKNSTSITGNAHDSTDDTLVAWDLAVQFRYPGGARSHVRVADAFRFPVFDENWSYITGDFAPLKPQKSRHVEAGASFPFGETTKLEVALFHMTVDREIGYDPINDANINFDPTKHDGTDVSFITTPVEMWTLRVMHSFRDGAFRSGPFKDKTISEVPHNRLTIGNTVRTPGFGQFNLDAMYTGERYFGNDFANEGKKMSGYTLINAGWLWNFSAGVVRVGINNLADRKTADTGFYYYDFTASNYGYAYYPLPTRSYTVSVEASL